jgi:thiamine biosynthesis protein ThiC
MQTYVILRRGGWKTAEELEAAAAVSARIGDDEMSDQVRWIRSYVLDEEDGTVGTVCIYQAVDEDAIMEHAQRADLPADEVILVTDTVIVRDDP